MKRRLCREVLITALAAAGSAVTLSAQGRPAEEGGLFLLLPVGAQAIGMGQAMVAAQPGSEAVWWNPAALAPLERREAAIHHSQSIVGTGDALTIVAPSSLLGVLALSVNVLNFGEEDIRDPQGQRLGSLLARSVVYAATYATQIGSRFNAGITYKVLQLRVDCTGACPTLQGGTAASSAVDLGAQYQVAAEGPLAVGVALRNVGPRLQVNDSPQSDPLPSRLEVGVLYRFAPSRDGTGDLAVRVASDVVTDVRLRGAALHLGADATWQERAHLRAGYVAQSGEGSGPSLGVGLLAGRLAIDVARLFSGLSADAGQAPTYFSLRFLF